MTMNKIKLDDRFIKLLTSIIDDWKTGKLATLEFNVLIYLIREADIIKGVKNVNYAIISLEPGDLFKNYTDRVNQVNKVMLSLKKKQRIWFEEHSGSRGNIDVEIQHFPFKNQQYLDISYRFQQNSDRDDTELLNQNHENPAELLSDEQRLEELKNSKDKLINQMDMNNASRAPQTDKIDYRETDSLQIKSQMSVSNGAIQSLSKQCNVNQRIARQALLETQRQKETGREIKSDYGYAEGIIENWKKEGELEDTPRL